MQPYSFAKPNVRQMSRVDYALLCRRLARFSRFRLSREPLRIALSNLYFVYISYVNVMERFFFRNHHFGVFHFGERANSDRWFRRKYGSTLRSNIFAAGYYDRITPFVFGLSQDVIREDLWVVDIPTVWILSRYVDSCRYSSLVINIGIFECIIIAQG